MLFHNQHAQGLHLPDKLTAFDIWCGGLSRNSFNTGEDLAISDLTASFALASDTFDLVETDYYPTQSQRTREDLGGGRWQGWLEF